MGRSFDLPRNFDANLLNNAALEARGLPRRPRGPAEELWTRIFTRRSRYERIDFTAGGPLYGPSPPDETDAFSTGPPFYDSWSGPTVVPPAFSTMPMSMDAGPFTMVSAQFTLPNVAFPDEYPQEEGTWIYPTCTPWIGFDGDTFLNFRTFGFRPANLTQAGVTAFQSSYGVVSCFLWYEWLNISSTNISVAQAFPTFTSSWTMAPGDLFDVTMVSGTGLGSPSLMPLFDTAFVLFENLTQGWYTFIQMAAPDGGLVGPLSGQTVEWIVERPTDTSQPTPSGAVGTDALGRFGSVYFDRAHCATQKGSFSAKQLFQLNGSNSFMHTQLAPSTSTTGATVRLTREHFLDDGLIRIDYRTQTT